MTTKMPYTPAERAQLYGLVHDAALGDPGEANEPILTPAERVAVDTLRDAVRRETAAALRPLLAGCRPTA